MNLKNLFNIHFLKENIRKSKGLLAFLLGIIPIINIIYLIILLTSSNNNLLDFNLLSFLTYAGMIFIPLALSLTFFGFVFKKKSVDFIMSKPISRKSIFITNTLGGILIILLFMLINTAIFGLFGLLFSNLTIPFALLVDYFLFWFISYVFIFTAVNLAIVLSGNLITSLVVLLLILLMVPYLNTVNFIADANENDYILCESEDCQPESYYCYGDSTCEEHLKNNEYVFYSEKQMDYHFIAPLSALNSKDTFYDTTSLFKMIGLSIIYAGLGYIIFKRRKMENNEMSFKSNLTHYLVKALTLFPVCLITYVILDEAGMLGWIISVVGIIIYSIVYDLITRKEIYRPIKSTIISLAIFLIFTGVYHLDFKEMENRVTVLKGVDALVYDDVLIKDKDIINEVIKMLLDRASNGEYYYYDFTLISDNKEYKVGVGITSELATTLNKKKNEINQENIKEFNLNHIDYIEYNEITIPVTKEITNLIKESIDKVEEFSETSLQDDDLIYLYTYKNHHYEKIAIPIKISKKLYEKIITYQNEQFINHEEKIDYESYYHLYTYDSTYFTDEDLYVFYYVINSNKTSFLNYLKTDNKVDMSKDHVVVESYYNEVYKVTISDVASFKAEFDRYKEKVSDNHEYQNLLMQYQNMLEYGATD